MLSLSDVVQVNVVGGVVFEFHLSVDGGLGLRVSRIYPSIVHVQDEDTPVPLEIMFVAVALGYKIHMNQCNTTCNMYRYIIIHVCVSVYTMYNVHCMHAWVSVGNLLDGHQNQQS